MPNRMRMNGVVVGNKMEKTVVVEVSRKEKHPKYKKYLKRETKVYAHTEDEIEEGTQVVVEESRPISKLKRWRVVEIKNSGK
jgi:small subunit ribosomal protein S17